MEYIKKFDEKDEIYTTANFIDTHIANKEDIYVLAEIIVWEEKKPKKRILFGKVIDTKKGEKGYRCILLREEETNKIYEIHGIACGKFEEPWVLEFMSEPGENHSAMGTLYIFKSELERKWDSILKVQDKIVANNFEEAANILEELELLWLAGFIRQVKDKNIKISLTDIRNSVIQRSNIGDKESD